eukprot:GHVR01077477.1.p1 GENE.GHVR01077477.1~~GHVR01077477.1.p1  ORF type:complete len:208 (+),score=-1.14 GHVR01077477.1:1181-1804(+)
MRKKNAVKKIENYWLKYRERYFIQKRVEPIKILQRYTKKMIKSEQLMIKKQSVLKAKSILYSVPKTHKIHNSYQNYLMMKREIKTNIYNLLWTRISSHYSNVFRKYAKTFVSRQSNKENIYKAEKFARYRLTQISEAKMSNYFKSFCCHQKYTTKHNSIIKIQSFFRMWKINRNYKNLKIKIRIIQRKWRKYFSDKMESIKFTHNYF